MSTTPRDLTLALEALRDSKDATDQAIEARLRNAADLIAELGQTRRQSLDVFGSAYQIVDVSETGESRYALFKNGECLSSVDDLDPALRPRTASREVMLDFSNEINIVVQGFVEKRKTRILDDQPGAFAFRDAMGDLADTNRRK
jgi:hypothetical protein